MKPDSLKTKIFLDSGDPQQTTELLEVTGFLDGQTTNPSLFVKSPAVQERLSTGEKLSQQEVLIAYKDIIQSISSQLPNGSVSIEVYADEATSAEEMMKQAREMNTWIPNAHIKLPTIPEGLKAARMAIDEGMKVNMTLVFNQEQAAAVYAATIGAKKGDVFVSPFEGRLHDIGKDGMDVITNIQKMFNEQGDGHVEVLAASIRDMRHFLYILYAQVDIITAPFKVIKEWASQGMQVPSDTSEIFEDQNAYLHGPNIGDISFVELDLTKSWDSFNTQHDLTDKGLKKFADDWNNIIDLSK